MESPVGSIEKSTGFIVGGVTVGKSTSLGLAIVNGVISGGVTLILIFGVFGGVIPNVTCGASKVIFIFGAPITFGSLGATGFFISILIGLTFGNVIFGAVIGSVTFKLIFGRTTSLGISIFGFIAISSFDTDFGRTFAIIWISTSGS